MRFIFCIHSLVFVVLFAVVSGCGQAPVTTTCLRPNTSPETFSETFLTDYDQGVRLARDEHKPMLVYFMAKNCMFSRQMTRDTLSDPQFRESARSFVCVQIDIGEKSSEKLCDDLQIKGSPTIQFISPGGIPLQRLTQPQPANELVHQMQAVLYSLAWKETKTYF